MREIKAPQGSAAWMEARRGKITASRIKDVMNFLKKGGESAARRNYRKELRTERITGRSAEHYVSPAMDHGTEYEPYARAAYEVVHNVMVDQVGFVMHPTLDCTGASSDGLVDDDGLIEIKCPESGNHLDWIEAGVCPEDHYDQIQWNLCCTERQYADFISFDPRSPEGLRIFIVRVPRDEERIAAIEAEVIKFEAELDAEVEGLSKRIIVRPAPPADTRSDLDQLIAMIDAQELVP